MRPLNLLLSLLGLLTGCDVISPFIGEDLKVAICDRDVDGIWRDDNGVYCGGADCDDGDRNVGEPTGWFRDVDTDTFGAGEESYSCTQPDGYVDHNGDCDDTDELVNPDSTETCNGYDDNCDGGVDDQNINVWYADTDMDTYGNPAVSLTQCDEPEGYVDNALDCDDDDATVNPDGIEVCDDGINQDCNDVVDDADGAQPWYADSDGDGYGDPGVSHYSCEPLVDGHVLDNTDCDDTAFDTSPTASEACGDSIDNDCDGEIDTDAQNVPWYRDADEDGYGDPAITTINCAPPDGYVGNEADCDDGNTDMNPSVEEVCNNGLDDNCDGGVNQCEMSGSISLTEADVIIEGIEGGTNMGFAVSTAGDINEDGSQDLLIGAYMAGNGGEVYLFLGPLSGNLDVSAADVTLTGSINSHAGFSVAGGCDLDGDADSNDFVVGAPNDEDGGGGAGAIWSVSGNPLLPGTYALDEIAVKKTGSPTSAAGTSLSCDGDVSGDGVDDIVVGAPSADGSGAVYVVTLTSDPGSLEEGIKLTGELLGDLAGTRVATIPDLNNDGSDDIAVGAYGDDTAGSGAGAVYAVCTPITTSGSLADACAKLLGETQADLAGLALSSAGDLDQDGYGDLLVGAFEYDLDFSAADGYGAAYFVLGPLSSGSLGTNAHRVIGNETGGNLGYATAGGCDINGDGLQDAILSARYAGASDQGILFGFYDPLTAETADDANFQLIGESPNDAAGSVALMDLNQDGYCDIVVGAHLADAKVPDAGKVYIIYGLGL